MNNWFIFIDGNDINSGLDINGNSIDLSYTDMVELDPYTNRIGNRTSINFVGFIITERINIVSFPKNYIDQNEIINIDKSDINLLSKFILSMNNKLGTATSYINDDRTAFPIKSYINIVNYYIKYGIYVSNYLVTTEKESGRMDLRETLRKSRSYFDEDDNLLFLPVLKDSRKIKQNFISDAMKFALYSGYYRFGKWFDMGVPYNNRTTDINKSEVLFKLSNAIRYLKKDIDKKLVNDLIIYYKWELLSDNKVIFGINDFAPVWEISTRFLLNKYLNDVIDIINRSSTSKIEIDEYFGSDKFNKVTQHLDKYGKNTQNIQYDDLLIGKNNVYIFDAKYYGNLEKIDYKQVAYHLFISAATNENIKGVDIKNLNLNNKNKIDALILPTHKQDGYADVMIDMTYASKPNMNLSIFKDLKIYKVYYPIKLLMKLITDDD